MALKATYEFLFVGKDDNSFLENYSYDLFQDHGERSGQLFINLEVQNNPVDAEELGSVIFETMQRVFFEDIQKDPYERFEASLKAINSVLNEFKGQKLSGYIGNLNVIVAAIVGDMLYLAQSGDAEAYLIRKRYVSVVTEGLAEESEGSGDVFGSIASGKIEAGDFVMFSSSRLLRYISKSDLSRSINQRSIAETLAELKDTISTEILGRVGLTGMIFSEATFDEVAAVEYEIDSATRNILESSKDEVSVQRESMTGHFFTDMAAKGKQKMNEVKSMGWQLKLKSLTKRFSYNFDGMSLGKDKLVLGLVLAIFVLGVGVFVISSQLESRRKIAEFDDLLLQVQNQIAEAETKGSYDKEVAKEILDKAYEDTMNVLNSGYLREKAKTYLVKIDVTRDRLDGVTRVENPKVYADLSEKRSDVNATGFVQVGDKTFVYEYNALYELVLDEVQDPLTIDDKESVVAATGFEERSSVIFLTKTGKLIEYREGTMSFMDTDDGSFRKGVSLASWSNKIYLLDVIEGEIWKYTFRGTEEKFGAAEKYVIAAGEADPKNFVDLAIDANVYALEAAGLIRKFYGGSKVDLLINNMPFNPLKTATSIYTNEKLDQVFVLDGKSSKVMVYRKNTSSGNLDYVSQYVFDGVGEVRDIYVDATTQKLYALTESKVYEVSLQ